MDEEELRRVYEVMREKELRIRVELDEVLERCRREKDFPLRLPSDEEEGDVMLE